MNSSERKQLRERKHRQKRQRKEFIAEQKKSIKKQRIELKEKKAAMRKRIRNESLNEFVVSVKRFIKNPLRYKKSDNVEVIIPKPERENMKKTGEGKMDQLRSEKKQLKEKRRHIKQQKKAYISEQKRSLIRQHFELKEKEAQMRKKIRTARIEGFVKSVVKFIKHPIKIKKHSRADLILRKQVKEDIKEIRQKKMEQLPGDVAHTIKRFWKRRYFRVKDIYLALYDFIKTLRILFGVQELRNNYLKVLVNSSVIFSLSFFFIYFLQQFVTVWIAKVFDIPSILFPYRIYWPLYTYSSLYSRSALIFIFGVGPFMCLGLGFVFFRLWIIARKSSKNLKIFILWTIFHAFNLFFGAYIAGVITRTGFIYTSEWLFMSRMFDVEEIIFLIASVIILIIIGYFGSRHFLSASNSDKLIVSKFRIVYMLTQVLIPWLLGNIAIFLVNFPNTRPEFLLLQVTSVLMIFPMFINYNSLSLHIVKPDKGVNKIRYGWVYIFLTIVVFIVIRFVIYRGIKFS